MVSKLGCEVLVHHFEIVTGSFSNWSANHFQYDQCLQGHFLCGSSFSFGLMFSAKLLNYWNILSSRLNYLTAPNKKNGKKDNFLAEMGTDDAMFKRKGDIVLPRNKYSFVLQLVLFCRAETYVLACNKQQMVRACRLLAH